MFKSENLIEQISTLLYSAKRWDVKSDYDAQ